VIISIADLELFANRIVLPPIAECRTIDVANQKDQCNHIIRTNKMHYFVLIYFNNKPLHVNKKIQLDATVRRHLFTAKSLYMFRASLRPSSGVLKTVTATSGIGHNIGAAASFQRGLTRRKDAAAPILCSIPGVAVTVFSTPDDGRSEARNM
jgi:hypothetical protein